MCRQLPILAGLGHISRSGAPSQWPTLCTHLFPRKGHQVLTCWLWGAQCPHSAHFQPELHSLRTRHAHHPPGLGHRHLTPGLRVVLGDTHGHRVLLFPEQEGLGYGVWFSGSGLTRAVFVGSSFGVWHRGAGAVAQTGGAGQGKVRAEFISGLMVLRGGTHGRAGGTQQGWGACGGAGLVAPAG